VVSAGIRSDRSAGDRRKSNPFAVASFNMSLKTKRKDEDLQMSNSLSAVLQELLQNTTNLKVLRELMTPDVTYVSLNFNNPELKKVEPWAGTHKGPQELADVFGAIQRCWKTLDFKVTPTPLSRVTASPSSALLPTNRT
jgi:hypothetical protein